MTQEDHINDFYRRCFQFDVRRTDELTESGAKLAHYTTAENGLNIIRNKTLWLRNAALMNDFLEIQHGRFCFNKMLSETDLYSRISALVDQYHPALSQEVLKWLDDADLDARLFTYMAAVGEHPADDEHGLLSMWRAYGGKVAGVALVFNTDFLQSDNSGDALPNSQFRGRLT